MPLIFPFVISPRANIPSAREIYTFGEPQHYFMEKIKILWELFWCSLWYCVSRNGFPESMKVRLVNFMKISLQMHKDTTSLLVFDQPLSWARKMYTKFHLIINTSSTPVLFWCCIFIIIENILYGLFSYFLLVLTNVLKFCKFESVISLINCLLTN